MCTEEFFQIVDENDNELGIASRKECHGNPSLIHRTVHLMVFSSDGSILLQKRSKSKDIQPGKWDTAAGGHLKPGESYEEGAIRETKEEIGIVISPPLKHLFDLKIRNEIESENVRVFGINHNGPFQFDPNEIDELRFWNIQEIKDALGTGIFTPNLEFELRKYFSEYHQEYFCK